MKKKQKIKSGMFRGRKRIRFPLLLLGVLVISSLLTFGFYKGYKEYIRISLISQLDQYSGMMNNRAHSVIEKAESELPEGKDKMVYLNSEITIGADELSRVVCKGLDLKGFCTSESIYPLSVLYNTAVTVIPERAAVPDNIFDDYYLVSNKKMFSALLEFGENSDDNGVYVCPVYMKDVPEIEQLYKDYRNILDSQPKSWNYLSAYITLSSVYCDKKTGVFIPHEGIIKAKYLYCDGMTVPIEKEIRLDLADTGNYELVQFSEDQSYPRISKQKIYGTDPEVIESLNNIDNNELSQNKDIVSSRCYSTVIFDSKVCDISVISVVDLNSDLLVKQRRRVVILFFIVSFLAVFILGWRKYSLNKAECWFEEYQRDLTSHLAHDIKTPLMAISGYAENIMETDPDEEKRKKYLDSIMGNVGFTKKLIERTAFLNSIESDSGKLKKEKINIEDTLRTLFDKYSVMFNERHIEVSLNGNADVEANRESTESLLENLVSNAVKYTAENGTLKAVISPKKLVMTNTVKKKINTKDLKSPFVRGDKSRSNTRGTGLGLSIADRAAELNGFKLSIKCTEKEFVSEIIFR